MEIRRLSRPLGASSKSCYRSALPGLFLTDLKRSLSTRDIPVYVVTMAENEHKAHISGVGDFYIKPIEREQLLNKLNAFGN